MNQESQVMFSIALLSALALILLFIAVMPHKDDEDLDLRSECYKSGGIEFREQNGLFIKGHVCIYQRR